MTEAFGGALMQRSIFLRQAGNRRLLGLGQDFALFSWRNETCRHEGKKEQYDHGTPTSFSQSWGLTSMFIVYIFSAPSTPCAFFPPSTPATTFGIITMTPCCAEIHTSPLKLVIFLLVLRVKESDHDPCPH